MDTNNKIGMLCNWMVQQENGKELLAEISKLLANDPLFPKPKDLMDSFGGAGMFASFRAGQASLLRFIEIHAQGWRDQENALLAKAEKAASKKEAK